MTAGLIIERPRRRDRQHGALRVLHVIARMPAAGTERQLAGMLRAAHKKGLWHATLCVLYPGYALSSEIRADGIPVLELRGRDPLHVRRLHQLRRLVRSGDYDVVHSSLWGANAFTRLAALDWNRPAVVASERRVEDFRGRPRRVIDRALRPVTDAYIGNSSAVGDFVQRAHDVDSAAVHIVPNGIDRAVFTPDGRMSRAPGAPVRLGGVGRLVHQKGFDVLLDALPAVLAHHDVELRIAGQGEERAALERRAVGLPVRFVGLLETPAAVAAFLRDLDLFVMPSRYEGLPNAVLEALACGLDVVATDAPGMRAALGDGGSLVPPDDPVALANAITDALSDRRPTPAAAIPSFADVAEAHLRVFEAAAGVAPWLAA
jgi:glycosyltransferase involved in cell wall biosynthesis